MLLKPIASELLLEVWRHLSRRRRIQTFVLMVLTLVVSLVEVISISAVVPFLALLSSPNQLDGYKWLSLLLNKISFLNPDNLLFCVTVVFIFLTIFSAVLRLLLLFVQTKLSYAIGAEYSLEIYRKTLYQSYEVHLNQNSSEFISGITSKVNNIISNAVNPVLVIVSCAFMLLAICSTLIFIEPLVTIAVFTFFAFIYLIVYGLTKKRLLINGLEVSAEQSKVIKTVQEGLGGIRDILLDGSQPIFTRIYGVADYKLRQAQATIYIIGNCPRYVIEAFGIVIIAVIAYLLTSGSSGFSAAIPVLGVIAFSAQRLLPLLQNAYASWVSIQGGLGALADAMNLLNQPISKYMGQPKDPIAFESQIVLRDVYFCYNSSTKWTLENLNLTITKGTRLGIIGPTGGGKSTLLDVLMGLLMPTKGNLIVDEQIIGEEQLSSWQSIIAHVPQNIFLADITIAENIAFGVECSFIDYDRVKKAASQAELSETIEEWGLKYDTVVGERGIRLSGGQRQRIGIARALYKNAKVIIFDEATSALDYETEESIIRAINTLDRDITIVTVAHRLTTLRHSDLIIKIEGGQCKVQGSYDDIIHE